MLYNIRKKVRSLVLIATQYKMPKKLLKFQNLLFRFMPKSMFQQMGFRKADFLLLCETMMELDFNNSLHKISCPTLLLYGEKDTANKNASIELAELLKNVELKRLLVPDMKLILNHCRNWQKYFMLFMKECLKGFL